jgi:hypothetical protein
MDERREKVKSTSKKKDKVSHKKNKRDLSEYADSNSSSEAEPSESDEAH